MLKWLISPLLVCTCFLFGCNSSSQQGEQSKDEVATADLEVESADEANRQKGIAEGDNTFAVEAAIESMTQIEIGKLGLKNTSNQTVHIFAQQILEDHTLFYRELTQLCERKNITLPIVIDKKHQKPYEKLAELRDAEFDSEFADLLSENLTNTLSIYDQAAKHVSDPDFLTYINKSLPLIRQHVRRAGTMKFN